MDVQNLLNQFLGEQSSQPQPKQQSNGSGLSSGLVGGALSGGVMALLVGNKKARKVAGKAATYGGAAVLGGLAYKAYQNWQTNKTHGSAQGSVASQSSAQTKSALGHEPHAIPQDNGPDTDHQLRLIKAMIAAAKADGHIDGLEQKRIFEAVEKLSLSAELKGMVFDLVMKPIALEELVSEGIGMEQKTEVYFYSCLAIDVDNQAEALHLKRLAEQLQIPEDLAQYLGREAQQVTGLSAVA